LQIHRALLQTHRALLQTHKALLQRYSKTGQLLKTPCVSVFSSTLTHTDRESCTITRAPTEILAQASQIATNSISSMYV